MVAAAIIGGAVVGAAGVAYAGSQAASATTSAANTAAGVQEQALQQQAALAAPYTALGQSAIPTYQALLGITPKPTAQAPSTGTSPTYGPMGPAFPYLSPGVPNPNFGKGGAGVFNTATGQPTTRGAISGGTFTGTGATPPGPPSIEQTLQNLPGYQFTKQQGLEATEAQLSAMGLGKSGNVLTAVDRYTTGLADQNYQQYLQDMLAPIQIGQGAAAGQAANIGSVAGNLSNIAINQGNNIAGIQANEIAGLTKAAGGAADNYLTYQTLQNLNPGPYGIGQPGMTYPGGGYIPPDSAPPVQP